MEIPKINKRWGLLIVIAIVVIVGGVAFFLSSQKATTQAQANPDQYQAVFLSNGQVYFGKITSRDSEDIVLQDVYYLRVQQKLQPAPTAEDNESQPQTSTSRIKLGNELHGPENVMVINKTQVLFTEPLRENSRVVQAILDSKASEETEDSGN